MPKIEQSENKKKILTKARELFLEFGYSKVTMEEIATALVMSKKTLYKEYPNKEAILMEVIQIIKKNVHIFVDGILANQTMTFVEKLENIFTFIAKQSSLINSGLSKDLMKNHPHIWCDIRDFQQKHAYEKVSELMKQGRAQGIIRDDINIDVIVMIYVSSIHSILNPSSLSRLPLSATQAFANVVSVIYEGILTKTGRSSYSPDHLYQIALEQQ